MPNNLDHGSIDPNAFVFMDEMTWPDWQRRIAAGAPLLLPVGSTEQHGPQLPLGTDVYIPRSVCEAVAQAVGGIVAPTLPYGYKSHPKSGGGQTFPGTISLSAQTLSWVIRDILHDFGLHGVKRLAVINGHFENAWPLIEGIRLADIELKRDGIHDMVIMRVELGDFVERATLDRIFPNGFPGTELEHASLLETSLMMRLMPDLVREERIPSDGPAEFPLYDRTPFPVATIPPSGVLADARGSSDEIGRWIMEDNLLMVTSAIKEGLGL